MMNDGALFRIDGTVSRGSTWDEYIYFLENGSGMVLTGLSFQLQFRSSETQDDTDLTLSTADSQLVLTNDDSGNPTILRINVAYTVIDDMEGDYIADLVSKDTSDKLTHWGHGVVTFRKSPIAF